MTGNDNSVMPGGAPDGRTDLTPEAASRKEFAARLRVLIPRGEQAGFAAKIGASASGLKKWLSGDADPSRHSLVNMSEVGGVSVGWLATGKVETAEDAEAEGRYLLMLLERARQAGDARAMTAFEEQIRANGYLIDTLRRQTGARGLLQAEAPTPPPIAEDVNTDALAGAIVAVDELIAVRKANISAEKRAKLIAIVYKQLTQAGGNSEITRGFVSDLLDVAV